MPQHSLRQGEDKMYAVARLIFSDWLSENADHLILWRSCDVMRDLSFRGVEVNVHGEIIELGPLGPIGHPFKLCTVVHDISMLKSLNKIFEDIQPCR